MGRRCATAAAVRARAELAGEVAADHRSPRAASLRRRGGPPRGAAGCERGGACLPAVLLAVGYLSLQVSPRRPTEELRAVSMANNSWRLKMIKGCGEHRVVMLQ